MPSSSSGRACPGGGSPFQPSPEHVALQVDAAGERLVVTVAGELDLDSAPTLAQALSEALEDSSGGLELDLAGVDFCDCSGLNVLLHVRHQAHAGGKNIVLHASSPAVDRLLSLTSTLSLFRTERTGNSEPQAAPEDATAVHPAHREEPGDAVGRCDVAGDAGASPNPSTQKEDASGPELATENAQLHRAMETRTNIDIARGMLMSSFRLTTSQSWQVLVTASQHTNTKLHMIADAVVRTSEGQTLPGPLAGQLAAAVQTHSARTRWQPPSGPPVTDAAPAAHTELARRAAPPEAGGQARTSA
ncbi:anti-sigma factor antagonist [Streptomyces sp. NPDC048279]|uniref:anti-sigma factor antagonist n=1 Tax=Streptomyces sp. NPDC048279 TaxID=3154714 RepID=UPI0034162E4D